MMNDSAPQQRRIQHQDGSLVQVQLKHGAVWRYRYFDMTSAGRVRKNVLVGTVAELPTAQSARDAAAAHRLRANSDVATDRPATVGELIARFKQERLEPSLKGQVGALDDGALSRQCARSYKSWLERWVEPRWSSTPLGSVEDVRYSAAVEDWLASLMKSTQNDKGLAGKSVVEIRNVMKLVFKRALKWGYVQRSPMSEGLVELPRGASRRDGDPRSFAPAEWLRIRQLFLVGSIERALVEVMACLGTRVSEALGLQWGDINFSTGVIALRRGLVMGRITPLKSKASRGELTMPKELAAALAEWKKLTPYKNPESWVFASPQSNGRLPYWPDVFLRRRILPVAAKAGLGTFGWHTFRHTLTTFGKQVLKQEETKALARHANIQTTSDVYGEMPLEAKRDAQARIMAWARQQARKTPHTAQATA